MERIEEILDELETTQMQKTKEVILEQINKVIEENINPAVASHGGMIELKDFDEESGRVLVMLQGGCSGCASSAITLKMGVENMLKHYVPEVTAVDGMDDPNYNNPYYSADDGAYGSWDPNYP
tara:strand:- start:825 stop:1193 length:369 start_codon:yes stop_codon:yes gene_type:complete